MRKLLFPAIIFAAIALYQYAWSPQGSHPSTATEQQDAAIESAYASHASGVQVTGQGTVEKVLGDDLNGSRHQRFILRLASGQTVLVAHNIDLAPKVFSLKEGDEVSFFGEYEWNDKGGVIHWTHRDPAGRHPAGWLRHNGDVFQ